jgi:hypothetical protein
VSSLVIYANEFDGYLNNGLAPESFKYRLLAEGDSWMDRSAMFHTSLLQKLAPKMNAAGDDVLIINLSRFGDTLRRIGTCADGEFRQWIDTGFNWKFDAILLSAGGNDFIDAARDPDAGQGILKDIWPAHSCLPWGGIASTPGPSPAWSTAIWPRALPPCTTKCRRAGTPGCRSSSTSTTRRLRAMRRPSLAGARGSSRPTARMRFRRCCGRT